MTDVVPSEKRSRMMAGIRGKHTKPEMAVRRALHAAGFRFRLHCRKLPGAPDVVMPGRRIIISVHGCFWHRHKGCRLVKAPATNPEFWRTKLDSNVERDRKAISALQAMGWRVLIVWECVTRRCLGKGLAASLCDWIEGDEPLGEIPENVCDRK